MCSSTSHSVCHKTADPLVFDQWDLCVLFIINVSGLFFKTEEFSCHGGNPALSLQWERSPRTAVWDSGLYTAHSWINQIYLRNPIPIALRLLVWVNVHCCRKGLQRWALMEPDQEWPSPLKSADMIILPALNLEQHFPLSAYGTNSMRVLPWSFISSSRRQDWKEYERSLHTALNLGWGRDTRVYRRCLASDCTA